MLSEFKTLDASDREIVSEIDSAAEEERKMASESERVSKNVNEPDTEGIPIESVSESEKVSERVSETETEIRRIGSSDKILSESEKVSETNLVREPLITLLNPNGKPSCEPRLEV
jgi:uncharacterized protein with von Willebrand factor type A (vWA) domain